LVALVVMEGLAAMPEEAEAAVVPNGAVAEEQMAVVAMGKA
jgi:hypothetical protein